MATLRARAAPTSAAGAAVRLRALRGATTVRADSRAEVEAAVRELLSALVRANGLTPEDVLSAIWSATPDVRSLYPAAVARAMGWHEVPMLCVSEMDVEGAPARCVRVLLHLAVPAGRALRPVYLRGARVLRPDLAGPAA